MLQISIGDIKATSEVKHVYNDVGMTYGEAVPVDFTATGQTSGQLGVYCYTKGSLGVEGSASGEIDVAGYAKDDCWWGHRGKKCDYDPVKADGYANLDVDGYTTGHLGVKGKTYGKLDVEVAGTVYLPVIVPNTIDDLALVTSAATAVANIATVQSNSAAFVHDGQFAFDVGHGYGKDPRPVPAVGLESVASNGDYNGKHWNYDPEDNTHLQLAEIGIIAAGLGLIQSADIKATSTVYDILNAQVDSNATAIANMHSIDVDAELATDVMVVADIVQFSYADVTATSKVSGITADHFEGLGGLEGGLVSSVATAVGNISNINVTVGGAADEGEGG
jgi:hypothetical protein